MRIMQQTLFIISCIIITACTDKNPHVSNSTTNGPVKSISTNQNNVDKSIVLNESNIVTHTISNEILSLVTLEDKLKNTEDDIDAADAILSS